jgi:GntR family transcriptional regulator
MLRYGIRTGLYRGALPLEFELVKSLGTSRNALRAALQHLVTEGVVSRVRGSGTHVVAHRSSSDARRLRSYRESQPDGAHRSTYRVLEARGIVASPPIAAALELEVGAPVILVERVALLDDAPVAVITSWLTADLVPGLLAADLQRDLYGLLEQELGLELAEAVVMIDAVRADVGTAVLLDTDCGAPLLYSEAVATLTTGQPVALLCSRSRPDRMAMTTTRWRANPRCGDPLAV